MRVKASVKAQTISPGEKVKTMQCGCSKNEIRKEEEGEKSEYMESTESTKKSPDGLTGNGLTPLLEAADELPYEPNLHQ